MKISKLFHWLYACVMLLPLVVAPIFAIYMHRHNVTNYEVNYTEVTPLEVDYLYQSNVVNSYADLVEGNIYYIDSLSFYSSLDHIADYNTDYTYFSIYIYSFSSTYGFLGDTIEDFDLYEYDANLNNFLRLDFEYDDGVSLSSSVLAFTNSNCYVNISGQSDATFYDVVFSYDVYDGSFSNYFYTLCDENSSMPSYTDFNVIGSVSGGTSESVTYNDTDIGSQFVYSIYLPLDKYFNVTQFLGLNNLYSWINNNAFNGSAPLGFNIFYILLSYWLMVSIFWLVFDVVMYVPNLAHRWLDKGSLQ